MKRRQRKKEVTKLIDFSNDRRWLKPIMHVIRHRRRPITYATIAIALERVRYTHEE